jgi:hypothetical protein
MAVIPKLGNERTINHLWQLVRRSKLSVGGKMTALVILKQMGEAVDLENPGEYFSWRDIKKGDIAEVANLGRFSMRAIIKELQQLKEVDDVDAMMLQFEEISAKTGGEAMFSAMIEDVVEMGDSGAAEFLMALAATTSWASVRAAARAGLAKLAAQNIFPQTRIIKEVGAERFYAAYSTDPAHPWQQQVAILFERGKNMVQALVFLLDFGYPWRGAIKDMFPTEPLTPNQFQREFIDRANRQGVEQRRVTYARARQFILDALEANQEHRVKLPESYNEFRFLFERRVADPSAETLAYAAEIDAKTVDEWGELAGPPQRGVEFVGPDGHIITVIDPEDLEDADWDEEPFTFDDLLGEVNDYYLDDEEKLEEDEKPPIDYEWMVNYLKTRHAQDISPEELGARWDHLFDFMAYLEETGVNLTEVEQEQLQEFITDFWDEEIEPFVETPVEEKQHVIETVRDLYAYLAEKEYIPAETSRTIAKAAATLVRELAD